MNDQDNLFAYYYEKHYTQAVIYTSQKISNKSDAGDIVMEAFFSCYKKIDTFDPEKASFATWFYFVLNNKIKNYYRDNKSYDDIDDVEISVSAFEDDLIAAMDLAQIRNQLADALLELSDKQRKIIILKYFKNKNASEIAQMMEINPGNVRVQLMRGVAKMREFFEKNKYDWE